MLHNSKIGACTFYYYYLERIPWATSAPTTKKSTKLITNLHFFVISEIRSCRAFKHNRTGSRLIHVNGKRGYSTVLYAAQASDLLYCPFSFSWRGERNIDVNKVTVCESSRKGKRITKVVILSHAFLLDPFCETPWF